jgi:membrane-bound serine protease (ClpP class)
MTESGRWLATDGQFGYAACVNLMRKAVLLGVLVSPCLGAGTNVLSPDQSRRVYILPVRDNIAPPIVYLLRRGVKEAMEAGAEVLVLDMETNGGRFDSTKEIIQILDQFEGLTVTYVNRDAYSAGAFIAVATQRIYMAPQGVIGAAAPILMGPGGGGVEQMPATMEAKMTSAVAARVRASAEKNGHNPQVVEAMINKTKRLEIDGHVLNEEGQILTLTDREAAREYGDPPKPLLSLGTVRSLEALVEELGYGDAVVVRVEPTGAERLASWLNLLSPALLLIGIVGIYFEIKTPGFGLPGIVGLVAFALYFLGSYVAGFSGMEWLLVFILGLVLVGMELFLFPGTILVGLAGAVLMLTALVMAMVDVYPGGPALPSIGQLRLPLTQILVAMLGAVATVWALGLIIPRTSLYDRLVSSTTSGARGVGETARQHLAELGHIGVTMSPLRPGGKARFGDQILDVISQGDLVDRGRKVRIIGHSASEAIVEVIDERSEA